MKKNHVLHVLHSCPSAITSASVSELDSETRPIRRLLCAILDQAHEDATTKAKLADDYKAVELEMARTSARTFIASPTYAAICDVLALPSDKMRTAAGI
jgi:hypothetical protein